jgi:hypothetical protein
MFCPSWSLRYLLLKGLCGAVSCHALRLLLNHVSIRVIRAILATGEQAVVSFISPRGSRGRRLG